MKRRLFVDLNVIEIIEKKEMKREPHQINNPSDTRNISSDYSNS